MGSFIIHPLTVSVSHGFWRAFPRWFWPRSPSGLLATLWLGCCLSKVLVETRGLLSLPFPHPSAGRSPPFLPCGPILTRIIFSDKHYFRTALSSFPWLSVDSVCGCFCPLNSMQGNFKKFMEKWNVKLSLFLVQKKCWFHASLFTICISHGIFEEPSCSHPPSQLVK